MNQCSANGSFLFEDGDKVCFIGDSITHGNFYMGHIFEYYRAHFPLERIELYNCGVSGDSTGGVLKRMDYDVLSKEPNKAVLMIGMNDIGRELYTKEEPSKEIIERRERALAVYRRNLEMIIMRLKDAHVEMILCTPTPYDQTGVLEAPNNYGCNDALGRCAEIIYELGNTYDCHVVDFHGPMTRINDEVQRNDPTATIIGPDRVHPGDVGVLIMAYLFLKGQGTDAQVCTVRVDPNGAACNNGKLEDLSYTASKVSFTYTPYSYPMYHDNTYSRTDALVPLSQDLNREIICIDGLAEGTYKMEIDGVEIGRYNSSQLSSGINIAVLENNPHLQYTARIREANLVRYAYEQKLRTIRFVEMSIRDGGIDTAEMDKVRRFLDKYLESMKTMPWYPYWKQQVDYYYELKPKEEELKRLLHKSTDDYISLNELTAYRVSIVKM